ncbi:MAG: glycoside hydrolase family 28 protein, partial [Spirochaetia bacterium]|nr:glycoside hydrolase family 28 protein [Spirochaetia bacterium]
MIYYPKAVGSVSQDTKSVQEAIDLAARSGGGTIYLSAGVPYRCKTLVLRSHITLYLENGARLEA